MLLYLYPALGISSQHNPPHHEMEIRVRSWVVTEEKAYKPHKGRKQGAQEKRMQHQPQSKLVQIAADLNPSSQA